MKKRLILYLSFEWTMRIRIQIRHSQKYSNQISFQNSNLQKIFADSGEIDVEDGDYVELAEELQFLQIEGRFAITRCSLWQILHWPAN